MSGMAGGVRLYGFRDRRKLVSRYHRHGLPPASLQSGPLLANHVSRSTFLDSVDDLESFDRELDKYMKTTFITEK